MKSKNMWILTTLMDISYLWLKFPLYGIDFASFACERILFNLFVEMLYLHFAAPYKFGQKEI